MVDKRIRVKGENINWDLVDIHYSRTELICSAYGVTPPENDFRSALHAQKHIQKHLKTVMKTNKVNKTLKEFSKTVIKLRNSHVNLEDQYGYRTVSHGRTDKANYNLTLEQISIIVSENIDVDKATKLMRNGLTFEEIVEAEKMPIEWALKLFTPATA